MSFYEINNQIIIKPISNAIFFKKDQKVHSMYTTRVTKKIISNMPEYFFPILVQHEIKKDFEIRTFYLDEKFYSAAIISQNDSQTSVDFRNYNFDNPNRIIPYKIPDEIECKLKCIMKELNLETGSIDMIYSNNKYYFLEINPMGQYDMISAPCNLMLPKHIAFFLCKKDNEYE